MLSAYIIITDIRLQQGFMWDKDKILLEAERETESVWVTVKCLTMGPETLTTSVWPTCSVPLIDVTK